MSKHKLHEHNLRMLGWSDEEIAHAQQILEGAEENKHPFIAALDQWVYWLLLLVAIVGVGAFSIEIVPILFFLSPGLLYPILLIIGLSLGVLFTIAIQDIHWLNRGHHGFAFALLPAASILVFVLVINYAQRYQQAYPEIFTQTHNPYLVGIAFAIGILAPYIYHLLTEHRYRRVQNSSRNQ